MIFFLISSKLYSQNQRSKAWVSNDDVLTLFVYENDTIKTKVLIDILQTRGFEGYSAICSKNGNLKYFTRAYGFSKYGLFTINESLDTIKIVIDTLHTSGTDTQGTIILPLDNFFYVFSVKNSSSTETLWTRGLWCSKIDKNDSILLKNLKLYPYVDEKLTAVRHCNGRDWWIIAKELSKDSLLIFLLDNSGLKLFKKNFILDNIPEGIFSYVGNIVPNIFGNKFAILFSTYFSKSGMIITDFNRKTGEIKNKFLSYNQSMLIRDSVLNNLGSWGIDKDQFCYYGGIFDSLDNFYLDFFTVMYDSSHVNYSKIIKLDINDYSKFNLITFSDTSSNVIKNEIKFSRGYENSFCGFKKLDTKIYLIKTYMYTDHNNLHKTRNFYYQFNIDNFPNLGFFYNLIHYDSAFYPTFPNQPNYSLGPDMQIGFKHEVNPCLSNCQAKVTFTDTSCCHFYRLWDFGDGTKSDTLWVTQHAELLGLVDTFKTVTHNYARPGRYKVTLQILNPYDYGEHLPPGQFLKDTLEQLIDVPFCSKAEFTAQSACGQKVIVQDRHCGGYDSLLYDYGDGSPFTLSNTHTYEQPGVYYVTQILKLDTFINTFTAQVVVPDCIYPDVSLNDTLCVFDTLKITYTGTNNYDTLWYSVEPVQGVQNIWQNLVSFEQSGQYRLWLHAANATFDTVWVYPDVITVLDCDELWIPNAFTPNNDGTNDVFNYVCRNCIWHSLEIFNRDTQPIFRCEGSEPCTWLGKTDKGTVPEGVYVYRLKVRKRDGREVERVGTVTVMR